ncbi:MAG: cysteine synthase A [Candidatus Ancillula sp.]|jgi:cysteine synthase A|nr:cysteine synthase A [Candidatus Ancillula sp.]
MKIYDDVTKVIGNTPLVKLNKVTEEAGVGAEVYAKLEFYNPANSVKDRIGVAIVDDAEKSGKLTPGGTIFEATSGNTGIALAMIGAARGYKVVIVLPESFSKERRALIKAFGAELVLTPAAEGMKGANAKAKELSEKTSNSILASQFSNLANPRAHREGTAEEIWADTDGQVDIIVSGAGTGGTVTGIGQALKPRKAGLKTVVVQAKESPVLTGGSPSPHKIQGISAGFIPDVLDTTLYDEVVDVDSETAIRTARKLATQEGLLTGISAGAAVAGALEIAKRAENAGKKIVVIVPDFGERYLSTPLFEGLV